MLLLLVTLRVTSCASTPVDRPSIAELTEPPPAPPPVTQTECRVAGWEGPARANAGSLQTLAWAPFRRPEIGWETYAPLIAREIGTSCGPQSEGFAKALAAWQSGQTPPADGIFKAEDFARLQGVVQTRRPVIKLAAAKICPDTADVLATARLEEGYSGKTVWLRPGALDAYRRMVAAAKAEVPEIAADPRNLTIFSGYRSPAADAARCASEGNCDGIVRAVCSPHRTGLTADVYVGQAPGFGPDSTADPNRLFMTRTATYRWLLANAHRFGWVNYPFEPWHWEWTGEAP